LRLEIFCPSKQETNELVEISHNLGIYIFEEGFKIEHNNAKLII